MISTPTVFIVGAGAGVPYGFPTGAGLRQEIIDSIGDGYTEFAHAVGEASQKGSVILGLRDALANTQGLSVDAVLEHRPELREVGKAAIAANLLPKETTDAVTQEERDWMGHLFSLMRTRIDDFADNRVSFVTFNYDRALEHRLTKALQNLHGVSHMKAWEVVQKIPIVHVYGQLGEYRPLDTDRPLYAQGDGVVLFADALIGTPVLEPGRVSLAASGIHLIRDDGERSNAFEEAQALIKAASQVVFLGFGFDETNVERLMPSDLMGRRLSQRTFIYGSAYGLELGEQRRARNLVAAALYPYIDLDEVMKRAPENVKLFKTDALGMLKECADVLV